MYIVEPDISLATSIDCDNKNVTVTDILHPSYEYIKFESKFHDVRLTISGVHLSHDTNIIVYSSNCEISNSKKVFFDVSGCNLLRRLDSGENEFVVEIDNPGECQYLKIITSESNIEETEEEIIHISYEYLNSNGIFSLVILCVIILFGVIAALIFFLIGKRVCAVKGHRGCYHIIRVKEDNTNTNIVEKSTKRKCCHKTQSDSKEHNINVETNASIYITDNTLEGMDKKNNNDSFEKSYLK